MNDIERARLNKIDDHAKITPVELMRLLIDEIENGRVKVDSLVILTKSINENNGWVLETRRANTTRDQEIVVLEMAKERCIRNWINT